MEEYDLLQMHVLRQSRYLRLVNDLHHRNRPQEIIRLVTYMYKNTYTFADIDGEITWDAIMALPVLEAHYYMNQYCKWFAFWLSNHTYNMEHVQYALLVMQPVRGYGPFGTQRGWLHLMGTLLDVLPEAVPASILRRWSSLERPVDTDERPQRVAGYVLDHTPDMGWFYRVSGKGWVPNGGVRSLDRRLGFGLVFR